MNIFTKNEKSILKDWILYREENLTHLTGEDRKHLLHYETTIQNILDAIPEEYRKNISIKLEHFANDFFDYCNYYEEKYYKAGFRDFLSLILELLGSEEQ